MFSKTPCTIPTTPRLPRIYRGVRGLPVGFSGNDDGIADFKFVVHRFQNFTQSGRTRGTSGSGWAISLLSWNGLKASAAPIRLSTVTSLANSSSDIPSVPAGHFGKT